MWTCPPKCSLKLHVFFKKQKQKKPLWYKHFPPSCVDEWGEEKKKITKILVLFFQMALSWNYRLQFVLNYITMQKCTLKGFSKCMLPKKNQDYPHLHVGHITLHY